MNQIRMNQIRVLLAASLLFAACVHSNRATIPTSRSSKPSGRVVMISYDGIGADPLDRHLKSGLFRTDGFALAASRGTRARRVVPVSPTLTSVAHIAMVTGAKPEKTGIVSNTFHKRGDAIDKSTRGFNEEIDADTIWEAALRQGKKVGAITFPGLDGKGPRRTADWGLVYSEPIAGSRIIELKRGDFTPLQTNHPIPPSFSQALATKLAWKFGVDGSQFTLEATLAALDSSNDEKVNYDTFFVLTDRDGARPLEQSWFPTWKDESINNEIYRFGSWSRLMRSDPSLSTVSIYLGAVSRTLGYPSSFRRMIDERVGFWPGPPDDGQAKKWLKGETGGIEPLVFSEQLERFSRFFTDATLLSLKEMPWDLILAYQPIVDEAEHQFLIESPRQGIEDPVRIAEARRVREHAFLTADLAFARCLEALPADAALVATGDHGLAPVEKSVRLNRQLVEWGYSNLDGERLASSSAWAAFTSGSYAHIYAFAPFTEAARDGLIEKLREMQDNEGKKVFEMVRAHSENDHENSGDILAAAFPRFSYGGSLAAGPIFAKTDHFGAHGGLNHHPEFDTFLLSYGSGVKRQVIEKISQTAIARYVSDLLAIEAPRDAE